MIALAVLLSCAAARVERLDPDANPVPVLVRDAEADIYGDPDVARTSVPESRKEGCSLRPLFPGRAHPGPRSEGADPGVPLRVRGAFDSDEGCFAAEDTSVDWGRDWLNRDANAAACDGNHAAAHGREADLYVIDAGVPKHLSEFGDRLESFDCTQEQCQPTNAAWDYPISAGEAYEIGKVYHGLRVASVASATSFGVAPDVRVRVYGVATPAGAKLVPDPYSTVCAMAEIARTIQSNHRPAVVNMSIEFTPADLSAQGWIDFEEITRKLRNYAVVVASVGNNSMLDPGCPVLPVRAADFRVTGVGPRGWYFPAINACANLAAPGRLVRVAPVGCPGGQCSALGSSFAAPLVAGAIAGSWGVGESREAMIARVKEWQTRGDRYPLFRVPE